MPSAKPPLQRIYKRLYKNFGPQHWWPGDTPLEIIVGAILTQNTNWGNVEKAIANLKRAGVLSLHALRSIPAARLARLIRPSGYFNVKTKRLKNFIQFVFTEYGGSLQRMAERPLPDLRRHILSVNGIGPETADSILLYAFDKTVFVVDAYTKRFLYRHNLIKGEEDYHDIQNLFARHLPRRRQFFNEYHALIVRLGKEFCRPTPRCVQCPLRDVEYSLDQRCARCFRALALREKCSCA